MGVAFLVGKKLLDGREHHAARFHRKLAAQVGAALRLVGRLAQQVLAAREGAEELVVQVVAVGQHDDGGIFHGRRADGGPGVERHRQALARPLGVPDHAYAPVAGRAARVAARFIVTAGLGGRVSQLRRAQGLAQGDSHRVELVVAGHLLDRHPTAVVLEHDEVPDQRQEALRVADAGERDLQLRHVRIGQRFAGNGAPGLEPLPPGGERAQARLGAVRDDEHLVHGEEGGQLGLVGLELVPGGPDGGVLVRRIL